MRFMANIRRLHSHNLSTLRDSPLHELSGSLGDLGTLLPLLIALTLQNSISLSTTLVFSGLANIATGVLFGIPLPVQPMKAIAAVAISRNFSEKETAAAGLFVAAVIAVFSLTGLLRWFGRVIPIPVVKGIQLGAGLSLVLSAGSSLLQPLGWTKPSWADNLIRGLLAALFLLLTTSMPRVPYALVIFLLGLLLASLRLSTPSVTSGPSLWHPHAFIPSGSDFRVGALNAGLGQLPLTTLNSIIAVAHLSTDLFPSISAPSVTSLGLSVAAMNLLGCWFGAMPVCHGSGGLAGQYRFGARSGSSIIVLGTVKLVLGLFVGQGLVSLLQRFPKALLGVMVIAAGVELAKVGESLNAGARDLWEEAEQEDDQDAEWTIEARGKRARTPSELERRERWTVMLVTVAGLLTFRNDAVGFAAGMLCHWSLKLPEWWDRWRGARLGRISLPFAMGRRPGRGSEVDEHLLDQNSDAPDEEVL
ncbi:hypothetical protein B0A49_12904 [Cryomyces minteri]|uniref:SLC26A/SulP transporter domain-containing protein n=2 Tax=Cryomyces minteri TaxID=331657 RepID=A0A4V5NCE9_9PEZI|nr:hypothetical protein B0A49_12904 [Cryomyces minteri]